VFGNYIHCFKISFRVQITLGAHKLTLYYHYILTVNLKTQLFFFKPNIGSLGIPHGPSEEKVAVVAVNDCDVAMALRFGGQIGNYSCAARGTQTGQKK